MANPAENSTPAEWHEPPSGYNGYGADIPQPKLPIDTEQSLAEELGHAGEIARGANAPKEIPSPEFGVNLRSQLLGGDLPEWSQVQSAEQAKPRPGGLKPSPKWWTDLQDTPATITGPSWNAHEHTIGQPDEFTASEQPVSPARRTGRLTQPAWWPKVQASQANITGPDLDYGAVTPDGHIPVFDPEKHASLEEFDGMMGQLIEPQSEEPSTPVITPPAVDHAKEPNAFNNYNGTAGKPPRSGF